MLHATLKNLVAHKLRLALSALAVVLGVAFVAGTLIFTDTLGKSFRDLFASTSADVTVSRTNALDSEFGVAGAPQTIPESVRTSVDAVDGVAVADGDISVEGVSLIGRDGKVVASAGGAPGLGINWYDTGGTSPLSMREGSPPAGPGEVAVDTDTAKTSGYAVGDTVRVLLPEGSPVDARLTGIFDFDGSLLGATLTAFDSATAQQLLLEPGQWTSIAVRVDEGADDAAVRDRIRAVLPPEGYEARTAQEQADASASAIEDGLRFINIFLLVFAGVAVVVGSFIILNTFSMLVAQRTRELALLRAVGASRRQVTRSVLVEALAVGVLGAVLGLGLGIVLAYGLEALFGAIGLELGDAPLVLSARTVVWSLLVGVLVTLAAAYVPARRAAKVPPVAAMRDDATMAPKGLRVRSVIGSLLTLAGVGALAVGLLGSGAAAASGVGFGVLLVLLGVTVLSPVLSRPIVGALGAAYPALFGTVGRLGRSNAQRNPRRTAATASALMIGLALIGAMGTLAASVNASIDRLVDRSLGADYVVSTAVGTPFSPDVAERVRGIDGVETVATQRVGMARLEGQDLFGSGVDQADLDQALDVQYTSGSTAGLSGDGILVDKGLADARGLQLGEEATFTFPGGDRQLRVGGVYEANQVLGQFGVSLPTFEAAGGAQQDNYVYVVAREGADTAALRSALDARLADYPNVTLKDQTEFKDEQKGQVSTLTNLIYGLLALSVLIAVLGIVNTLALSVIERTREIGLLRAVGMSRRQLRRMVRLESVVISLFGAVLGLTIGVGFGVALQRTLADDGISELAVPVGSLLGFLVVAAVIGVLAAVWPARRAARLDVLRAIATQ